MISELRKKGRFTRLLLLLEIVTEAPSDQKTLAGPIGITPQAVSEYLNKMKEEGLVTTGPEGPRATVKGVDTLHHDLLVWKEFIDSSINRMDIIRSTDALADENIRKGDRVFLMMKNGLLSASVKGSGSEGIAEMDAEAGEMVTISSLTGLVDLEPGTVHLLEIPPVRSGGGKGSIRMKDVEKLIGPRKKEQRVAGLDLEAVALLKRSGIECVMEIPPPESIISTSLRGLDILAIGTPFSISSLIRTVENRNMDLPLSRSKLNPS